MKGDTMMKKLLLAFCLITLTPAFMNVAYSAGITQSKGTKFSKYDKDSNAVKTKTLTKLKNYDKSLLEKGKAKKRMQKCDSLGNKDSSECSKKTNSK